MKKLFYFFTVMAILYLCPACSKSLDTVTKETYDSAVEMLERAGENGSDRYTTYKYELLDYAITHKVDRHHYEGYMTVKELVSGWSYFGAHKDSTIQTINIAVEFADDYRHFMISVDE